MKFWYGKEAAVERLNEFRQLVQRWVDDEDDELCPEWAEDEFLSVADAIDDLIALARECRPVVAENSPARGESYDEYADCANPDCKLPGPLFRAIVDGKVVTALQCTGCRTRLSLVQTTTTTTTLSLEGG